MKHIILLVLFFSNFTFHAQGSYDWHEHNRATDTIDWGESIIGILIFAILIWIVISISKRSKTLRTGKKSNQKNNDSLKYYEWRIPQVDSYIGDMENGKKHGRGEITYADNGRGARFYKTHNGSWFNDKKHGPGIEITLTPMNIIFTKKGNWKNGEIHGEYERTTKGLSNDYHFIGEEIKNDQYKYTEIYNEENELERCRYKVRQKGKWIYKDLVFEGEWRFIDYKIQHHNYYGKITYKKDNQTTGVSKGDIYEGNLSDEFTRQGFGKMQYLNGSIWEGRWDRNRKVFD